MADINEKLTQSEKFVAIKATLAIQNDDNKFELTTRAALMQVNNGEFINYEMLFMTPRTTE